MLVRMWGADLQVDDEQEKGANADLARARGGILQLLAALSLRMVLRKRPIILCYHSVGSGNPLDDPGFLRVPPQRFLQQLSILARAGGRFASVSEIASALGNGSGAGLVSVTFDDGYQDNHSVVLPILRRYGLPATVFVTIGLIDQPSPWMPPRSQVRMMNVDELREMAAAGVELGAHTLSHPDLTNLDASACEGEVRESKNQLEALINDEVTSFAYPYFRFDDGARKAVREAGMVGVTGLSRGSFDDLAAVPRALVTRKDGLLVFILRVYGVYEPLVDSAIGVFLRRLRRRVRAVRARPGRRA
jgi:peptidoglycan/xylan/chitin deacetylase (PgdA/CDA1 family)